MIVLRTASIALLGCLLLVSNNLARAAQSETQSVQDPRLPKDIEIEFKGEFRLTEGGEYRFNGPVSITSRNARIQADRLSLRENRFIEAEGNVLIVWQGNRIFGERITYDLELETGEIENASGQVQADYLFWAERARKIGPDKVHLESARVTTCTQPVPYWSFAVSSATIRVNKYARMWNVRFSASRVPMIYLPYLLWPIKRDRAAGLLFPEFQDTQNRGRAITQQLFIPLGRSADLTLLARYYTEAGLGGGGELRFVPNELGTATLNGFYIKDKVAAQGERGRYRTTYRQTQSFERGVLEGFRMVADINVVSDFNYFSDFERDLELVTSPTILARLELSRNGSWTSMNVREVRREQLFADGSSLVQQTLPEIEWRGRSRKLGKTPLYLTYESSLASVQQREKDKLPEDNPIDADYIRGDFFPTLSMPLSRIPWIEITPELRYRWTYYTQSQQQVALTDGSTQRQIRDRSLSRALWGAGLDINGPKLVRIFDRGQRAGATQYKHLIEPRIVYGFQEEYDRLDEIVLYDEVDRFGGAGNQVSYSIAQRLFAKRPRAVAEDSKKTTAEPELPPDEVSTRPDLTRSDPFISETPLPEVDPSAPQEPVEIATFELRQTRSFDSTLSRADFDGDGEIDDTSSASAVQLIGRFNPTPLVSLDLRSSYDILFREFSSVNISGGLRSQLARLRFSLFHRNGLGLQRFASTSGNRQPVFVPLDDDTQLRLTTGFTLFGGKLQVDLDGSVDFNPAAGQRRVPDRRIRVQYSSQCCTILVEQLDRAFSSATERRDLYFRVDLRGIGKILDFSY